MPLVSIEELRPRLEAALARVMPKDHAAFTAEYFIRAACRKDERMSPLEEAVGDVEKALTSSVQGYDVVRSDSGIIVIDLRGVPGITQFAPIVSDLRDRV